MIVIGQAAHGDEVFPARLYGAHSLDGELVWVTATVMREGKFIVQEDGAPAEVWEPATDTTVREADKIDRLFRFDGTRNPAGEYRYRLVRDATP